MTIGTLMQKLPADLSAAAHAELELGFGGGVIVDALSVATLSHRGPPSAGPCNSSR
jgi:uncharacterized transporter YbjL